MLPDRFPASVVKKPIGMAPVHDMHIERCRLFLVHPALASTVRLLPGEVCPCLPWLSYPFPAGLAWDLPTAQWIAARPDSTYNSLCAVPRLRRRY